VSGADSDDLLLLQVVADAPYPDLANGIETSSSPEVQRATIRMTSSSPTHRPTS